jgi:hypothetical protein
MLPSGILLAVIELAAIFASVTFKSTIDAVTTAEAASLSAILDHLLYSVFVLNYLLVELL